MGHLIGFSTLATSKAKAGGGRKGGGGSKASGGATDSQMISLIVNNLPPDASSSQIDGVITQLSNVKGKAAPEAQMAIQKLNLTKAKATQKANESDYSIANVEDSLSYQKDAAFQSSPDNLQAVAKNYHDIYRGVTDDYESNVITKAYENGGVPTDDQKKYFQELKDKTQFYNGIVSASQVKDDKGNLGNFLSNGIVAVPKMTSDGKIASFDFADQAEVQKDKSVLLTDAGVQSMSGGGKMFYALPVKYIDDPENPGNQIAVARSGNVSYKTVPKVNQNTGLNTSGYGNILVAQNTDDPAVKAVVDNGMVLNKNFGVEFADTSQPQPNSVTRKGTDIWYTDENGQSYVARGNNLQEREDYMRAQLQKLRPESVGTLMPGGKLPVAPKSISASGDPEVLDMGAATPSLQAANQFLHSDAAYAATPGAPAAKPSSFFASKAPSAPAPAPTTTPEPANKPNAPKESVSGQSWVGDIVAKGAKFFAGQT